ncbi:MAG: stage III sporulation protein AB [Lachnospiraceae bacterium]|nr:stage III sporulation protein AB [Lachnospiraceae bacterium]
MHRLLGGAFILTGCLGMGLYYKEQLGRRLYYMRQLRNLLTMLMSEIRFGRATLPECCRKLSGSMPEPISSGLSDIYERSGVQNGEGFFTLFITGMRQCLSKLPLLPEDVEAFLWFAEHEGVQDGQLQLKLLQESYDRLHSSILLQESQEKSGGRLAVSLGMMGGLLLVIVLI